MRRAAKRDTSEAAIIRALEACGFSVLQISVKDGPDLVAARAGWCVLIECKTGKKKLRKGQQTFAERWKSQVYVLREPSDVLQLAEGERVDG